jgi:transposase
VPGRHSLARPAGTLWDPIKIHTRFSRWAASGVWGKLFEILAADADNEYEMIDSTVRAHQHSAGAKKDGENQAIGRSKGGLSTKIHLGRRLGQSAFLLSDPGPRA